MTEKLSVFLTGTSYSYLLYETIKSSHGQEGFLFGELIEQKKTSITDNNEHQVNIIRKIKINAVLSSPYIGYFYDGIGRLDEEKLDDMLGCWRLKAVAWYRYGQNIKLTSREKRVHKQLANYLKVPLKFFTCGLLYNKKSDNRSTHSFFQNFVHLSDKGYSRVPMHVVNLSEPNNLYKYSEPESSTFNEIVKDLHLDYKKPHGLATITNIQNHLQKKIICLLDETSEDEKRVFQLEREISQKLELARENSAYDSDESSMEVVRKMPKTCKGRKSKKKN